MTLDQIISVLGLIVNSALVVFFGVLTRRSSIINNRSAKANNQLYMDQIISSARSEMRNLFLRIIENTDKDKKNFTPILNECKEEYLNAFELACALYLDNEIDKNRFILSKKNEIIKLKTSKNSKGELIYAALDKANQYPKITKVYLQFETKKTDKFIEKESK